MDTANDGRRRVVLLRGAAGPSNPTAFTQNPDAQTPNSTSTALTTSSSSEASCKALLNSYVAKCRMIMADLETTSVSLEGLISEGSCSKTAMDMELSELQKMVDDFTAAHLDILNLCETLKLDSKPFLDRRQRFLVQHKNIRNLILSKQDALNPKLDAATSSSLKLPKVEIPTFEGSFEQWSSWYKLFESLIHKNESLDNMAKFSYLRSRLKGIPLTLVEGYPFEGNYYDAAFLAIVDHYNDPMKRISSLLDTLQNSPSMKEKKQTLRGLISLYRANATALQITFQQNNNIDPLSQLLIHSFLSKADKGTRQDWEREIARKKKFASFTEFIEFMEGPCNAYERAMANSINTGASSSSDKPRSSRVLATTVKNSRCYYCQQSHTIYKCPDFLALSVVDRAKHIADKGSCRKCLSSRCNKKCKSVCKRCNKGHNSLLHDENHSKAATNNTGKEFSIPSSKTFTSTSEKLLLNSLESNFWIGHVSSDFSEALLATAQVKVSALDSSLNQSCRAVVDSASQSDLITTELVKQLKLKSQNSDCNLNFVEGYQSKPQGNVKLKISAQNTEFSYISSCEIVDEIIDVVPQNSFDIKNWNLPKNLTLADPNFNISSKVHLLLGLRVFWKILGTKKVSIGKGLPCLRNSKLGWLVTDDRELEENSAYNKKNIFAVQHLDPLADIIKRFWLLDEFDSKSLSFEEVECERNYMQMTTRDISGRFIVSLPFKIPPEKLGHSRSLALKRFSHLEKRFAQKPHLKAEYVACMSDYIRLGHMRKIDEGLEENSYYIPHHAVLKETSTSTKLRAVFDASMRTTSGLSLNDCLMVGPVVQSDLVTIIMRFRAHKIVFSADIVKMYRQILLHPDCTRFQRIFWRPNSTDPLEVYEIVTLAFGTSSAPFLATRCLKRLVELEGKNYPDACSALLNDFYIDDVLTGADDIETALKMQNQLQNILKGGGFVLSKWCSNSDELLSRIPIDQQETSFPFSLDNNDKVIKSLGLLWSSKRDSYQIKVNIGDFAAAHSKRHILSIIASIFDPLGLLSPITVVAKLLMQALWVTAPSAKSSSNNHWDEKISDELWSLWTKFASSLPDLLDISIPRYLFHNCDSFTRIELHGFSDASEKAYGAVVYVRAVSHSKASSWVHYAKSRVAPLKKQSLPRLELCAAVLLCEIVDKVRLALKDLIKFDIFRLWTDSQIVLHWIASASNRWLPFIANRVQKIQNSSNDCFWDYVNTKENPADLISRGSSPRNLQNCDLWWHGPDWLRTTTQFTTVTKFIPNKKPLEVDLRQSKRLLTFMTSFKSTIFSQSSNYLKLVRLVAWISRFVINAHWLGPCFTGPLKILELREATKTLVKLSQMEYFLKECKNLKMGIEISKSSPLATLSPFLDNHNLIRVGGRLQHSELSYEQQHPLILHPKHPLTKLILRYFHEMYFHAGPQLLRSRIRNQFWILRINSAIRHTILTCNTCIRIKAETRTQFMAALPKARVTLSKPFSVTGVDYAGPFSILGKGGRHKVMVKAYIAVFVCFSTKAIHLELVSDLTAEAFLAALTRFISRRGIPNEIYSDNGTNFVGAKNLLKKQFKGFLDSNFEKISNFATAKGCQWHFIPPYSPHFGGLWEAGVKSVKSHLRFVLSKNHFTFEQWATLLAQIEACLNSRPLIVDSTDPNEPSALTPGHFLIGGAIVGLPNPDLMHVPENRLKHWDLVKAQAQRFWKRWSCEYLNSLQQRSKWKFEKDAVKVGDIVIIKEENTPPTSWPLGKIMQLHPGIDGCTRVVTLKTKSGSIIRPIIKIKLKNRLLFRHSEEFR